MQGDATNVTLMWAWASCHIWSSQDKGRPRLLIHELRVATQCIYSIHSFILILSYGTDLYTFYDIEPGKIMSGIKKRPMHITSWNQLWTEVMLQSLRLFQIKSKKNSKYNFTSQCNTAVFTQSLKIIFGEKRIILLCLNSYHGHNFSITSAQ